jgi:hypothetical protein
MSSSNPHWTRSFYSLLLTSSFAVAPAAIAPADAANVTLSGLLVDSCTLSLATPGALAASADGATLGSEQSGGTAATLTLIAIGGAPVVQFSAPSLSSPVGWSASPTTAIRYTSVGGANQAYTSGASSRQETGLIDSFTIHGRVTSGGGFAAGTYTVTTVATCQQ